MTFLTENFLWMLVLTFIFIGAAGGLFVRKFRRFEKDFHNHTVFGGILPVMLCMLAGSLSFLSAAIGFIGWIVTEVTH